MADFPFALPVRVVPHWRKRHVYFLESPGAEDREWIPVAVLSNAMAKESAHAIARAINGYGKAVEALEWADGMLRHHDLADEAEKLKKLALPAQARPARGPNEHDENCFIAGGGGGMCNCSLSKDPEANRE